VLMFYNAWYQQFARSTTMMLLAFFLACCGPFLFLFRSLFYLSSLCLPCGFRPSSSAGHCKVLYNNLWWYSNLQEVLMIYDAFIAAFWWYQQFARGATMMLLAFFLALALFCSFKSLFATRPCGFRSSSSAGHCKVKYNNLWWCNRGVNVLWCFL